MRKTLNNFSLVTILTILLYCCQSSINAQEMVAPGYRLILQQTEASPSARIGDLLSNKDQEIFDRYGFVVHAISKPISLTIERTQLSFDDFKPGISQFADSNFRISSNSQIGLQATVTLIKRFSTNTNDEFPKYDCDDNGACSGWRYDLLGKANKIKSYQVKESYKSLESTKDYTFANISPRLDSESLLITDTLRVHVIPPNDIKSGNYSSAIKMVIFPNP